MNYKEIAELYKHQNIRAIYKIARADAKKRDFRKFEFDANMLMLFYFKSNFACSGFDIYCDLSRSEIKAIKIYIRAYKMYKENLNRGM